ncbi:unnamed protein product [Ascophyllum nodosum]
MTSLMSRNTGGKRRASPASMAPHLTAGMGKSAPKPGIQHVLRRVANVVKGEESYAGEPWPEESSAMKRGIPVVMKYAILAMICALAFFIRLFAVVRYESVIHEFDPYFNFRTTKFLATEGFLDFLNWFDDRGWYPLGRTIGGTIYPGLMATAASIYWILHALHITINIRNMCVFLAPLFAANTAVASYLLTTEVTKRSSTGLLAAAFTAIVPSYISRSVGGSYDNEGVAIFALIFVFYLWIKSVNTGSMMWSCLTAIAYFYMVAAWGGYVFIINIIPIYVVVMVVAGRYSNRLYIAYSTFYALGSIMAMQARATAIALVPFVGFNVVKQAECMASHGVFVGIQVYALGHYLFSVIDAKVLQRMFVAAAVTLVSGMAAVLVAAQLLGLVQWTGRSLTLLDPTYASKYIPIIASVSEHQPTTWTSFYFDLNILVPLSPVGLWLLYRRPTDGAIFVIIYGTLSWYFAGVMVRLMLTLAPIACILAAVGMSGILQRFTASLRFGQKKTDSDGSGGEPRLEGVASGVGRGLALAVTIGATMLMCFYSAHSSYVSSLAYSSPSIVIEAGRTQSGTRILYDDYREAYYWLRHNTDPDAKIMSWWDYGYQQMSAMSNRTVLVDNNTWNNTHIATVGRALASSEEKAYPIMESLDVDYVLVIFGGVTGYSSDDINKFLWPVRIGSGVFPDDMHHEKDFLSMSGQFDVGATGSKVLQNCVAYKLCYYRFGELRVDYNKPPGFDRARNREVGRKDITLETMEEAFTSEHWIVRIYKVLPRRTIDPTEAAARIAVTKPKPDATGSPSKADDARYRGCYSSEVFFGGREYVGGASGANYNLIFHHAKQNGKRFFAVGRAVNDGHAFVFDYLEAGAPKAGDMRGEGCERPCSDVQTKVCGCTDLACTGPKPQGEQHNRRWAVYELPPTMPSRSGSRP